MAMTGLTTQKVSVLYTLLQANLNTNNLTLPNGIDPPNLDNIVEFNNPDLSSRRQKCAPNHKGIPGYDYG